MKIVCHVDLETPLHFLLRFLKIKKHINENKLVFQSEGTSLNHTWKDVEQSRSTWKTFSHAFAQQRQVGDILTSPTYCDVG